MHEMKILVFLNSENWEMMIFLQIMMLKFSVFAYDGSRGDGEWDEQVIMQKF